MYRDLDYTVIDVPWAVPSEIARVTYDWGKGRHPYQLESDEVLVGSAEQSFIHLRRKELLDVQKRYVALSPCFRGEDIINGLYRREFMKVELYIPNGTLLDIHRMMMNAIWVFAELSGIDSGEFRIIETHEGWDIILDDIELGSYGRRKDTYRGFDLWWAYGTGIAEPRFSEAVRRYKQGQSEAKGFTFKRPRFEDEIPW